MKDNTMKCNSCEKEITDNSQLVFCTDCSGYENHVQQKVNYTEKEIKNIKDHAFDRGFYIGLSFGFIFIIVISVYLN